MSDSVKKWTEIQEDEAEERLRVIAQNGNNGLHYVSTDTGSGEQLEFDFTATHTDPGYTELMTPLDMKVEFDPENMVLGAMEVYKLDADSIKTIEDVALILKGLDIQILNYGDGLADETQELVDKGFFRRLA